MVKNNINKATFAKRLKQLIKENNETTYSIAEITDLTPATISRYANGIHSPKKTTIRILAQYFNVNPGWLMGYDVERELENINVQLTQEKINLIKKYKQLSEKQKAKLEGMIEGMLSENNQEEDKKGA